ncbi:MULTISPECIES: O-acetyl-ADP-ribose deacetylase [unclassified Treponema]|uniref:O-acetyl-ADP-ribose deacetylase n=1 Tax=unclassified Treponema TaxID=2638727 RepID=UPI0020A30779|nr:MULTISPECIES: O-acetyl-ADP-ribose deacetylase [unclassified Treponema]UTC66777.1 O-acetyl-ADP-ribose deacetylase [Treponema sp. OMZ 789]UTC69510.1 O-acetyl-ADP-ribose deacetylase [Treponema sp. OMZ 790]UTC72224.1 O-acetyl-ADP-ribose deacetylase [Treponema sp. OMZ 791]
MENTSTSSMEIINADITKLRFDAIVNAANTTLLGGSGVDGAIHAAAGPELLEECRKLKGCKTGEAKITKAYKLPSKYVIHTPGPVYEGGNSGEAELLAGSYRSCLNLALEYGCKSIAFPCISTGVYGYPKEEAAKIALKEISAFLKEHKDMKVFIVCFGKENEEIYRRLIEKSYST